jgi:hypothetical protein
MGTRARIAIENADGSFTSIYTHWDGYVGHHGPILFNHYSKTPLVRKLIALGDLSVLGPRIGRKHKFNSDPEGTVCTAYGRDRGETECAAVTSPDLAALGALTQETGGEWLYVWRLDRKWYAAKGGAAAFGWASQAPGPLRPLTDWLAEIAP